MDKNKPTAGRTKAIHRRLELSFNLYLLLLFVGQNRASKSLLHITPRISRFLQSFQQIKHLKDNPSHQNPLVIVVFLGWPYYISSPSSSNGNLVVLFHNSISSWNSSYLYVRLISSRSSYIKQCVHHPCRMGYRTVVIIFLTVAICFFRPSLNLLCRPVIIYSPIFPQLKLYGRHLHANSLTKC